MNLKDRDEFLEFIEFKKNKSLLGGKMMSFGKTHFETKKNTFYETANNFDFQHRNLSQLILPVKTKDSNNSSIIKFIDDFNRHNINKISNTD